MKTAVINIKVEDRLKKDAQRVAKELGFSLSSLINSQLRQVIKTRTITVEAKPLELTDYAKKMLKEAREDIKKGFVSPTFDNAEDAIAWLDDPKRKYVNQLR